MYGMGERERGATALLHDKLSTSRVGMRWERIMRTHAHEVDSLMAVHPELRLHVAEALRRLADAEAASRRLDGTALTPAIRVLDDLQRLGGFELKFAAAGLREELDLAHGRRLDDVLA